MSDSTRNREIAQGVVNAMWAWYESRPRYPKYPLAFVDRQGRVHRAPTPEEIIEQHIKVTP